MKQNIYDIPGFFESYQRMRDKQYGLNVVIEQPAILTLLPYVENMSVLDLGCGSGDLCRRIKALGAKFVTGLDISKKMLELASKDIPQGVSFQHCAMEDAQFPLESFDLVISSLAFHYIKDLPTLLKNINGWLKPGGLLLFSIEHPISTCSQGIHHGWIKDSTGTKICWPVDEYHKEGIRESHWFIQGVIKYHRGISSILNNLLVAGFTITAVDEPVASEEDEKLWPELKDARRRPPFLIIKASKDNY